MYTFNDMFTRWLTRFFSRSFSDNGLLDKLCEENRRSYLQSVDSKLSMFVGKHFRVKRRHWLGSIAGDHNSRGLRRQQGDSVGLKKKIV